MVAWWTAMSLHSKTKLGTIPRFACCLLYSSEFSPSTLVSLNSPNTVHACLG